MNAKYQVQPVSELRAQLLIQHNFTLSLTACLLMSEVLRYKSDKCV